MNQSTATPRLSIILPLGDDAVAFEDTLVSVLENRPSACEILVIHDGTYDDPFELSDEVRFVVSASNGLIDSVADGCDAAWGRYIHVLQSGFRATNQWADTALAKFEHTSTASVTPVIRDNIDRSIIAAGWNDSASRLMDGHSEGTDTVEPLRGRHIGSYLSASFWRREVLRSLTRACVSLDPTECTYAYTLLARQAGWNCVVADHSTVTCDADDFFEEEAFPGRSSLGRGQRLRKIRNHLDPKGSNSPWMALLASVPKPSLWSESIGQIIGSVSSGNVAKKFNADLVHTAREYEAVRRAA